MASTRGETRPPQPAGGPHSAPALAYTGEEKIGLAECEAGPPAQVSLRNRARPRLDAEWTRGLGRGVRAGRGVSVARESWAALRGRDHGESGRGGQQSERARLGARCTPPGVEALDPGRGRRAGER